MKKILENITKNLKNKNEDLSNTKHLISDISKILKYINTDKSNKAVTWVRHGVAAYSSLMVLNSTFHVVKNLITESKTYFNIQISEDDALFHIVMSIIQSENVLNTTTLEARSNIFDNYNSGTKKELKYYQNQLVGETLTIGNSKGFMYTLADSREPAFFTIAGHKVSFFIKEPDRMHLLNGWGMQAHFTETAVPDNGIVSIGKKLQVPSIIIQCSSEKARDEILLFLREKLYTVNKPKITLYLAKNWGSFSSSHETPERDISTVILKDGQLNKIINELDTFIKNEDSYNNMGVPYHHGILLSGPPGTGKSSTAKAVASYLGLDTYYISLASINSDDTFNDLVQDIKPRSILLLEDIDTVQAAKNRDNDKGIKMQSLLNALDGALSPHGVVTIATTNHIEQLDEAIIRPGRMDTIYHIDYLDNKQLKELCTKFIGTKINNLPDITGLEISPAMIIGKIKKNILDPEKAMKSVIKLINKKVKEKKNDS